MLKSFLKENKGFTLLEGFFLISMVSLAIAIATPSWDSSESDLNAATIKLVSDIRYAQSRAMITGVNHVFRTVNGSTYELYETASNNRLRNPSTGLEMLIDFSQHYNAVTFDQAYSVEFDAFGRPNIPGALTVVLLNGNLSRNFRIESNTGLVTLSF